jgi:hypothetical protein
MKKSGMLWKYNIPQKEIQETYRISKAAYTVSKAKREAGPQHKGDGKFRHPYRLTTVKF